MAEAGAGMDEDEDEGAGESPESLPVSPACGEDATSCVVGKAVH